MLNTAAPHTDDQAERIVAALDRLSHALEQRQHADGPDYLSVATVARRLSVDESTVRDLVLSGALSTVRVGRRCRRVPVEAYEAFRSRLEAW